MGTVGQRSWGKPTLTVLALGLAFGCGTKSPIEGRAPSKVYPEKKGWQVISRPDPLSAFREAARMGLGLEEVLGGFPKWSSLALRIQRNPDQSSFPIPVDLRRVPIPPASQLFTDPSSQSLRMAWGRLVKGYEKMRATGESVEEIQQSLALIEKGISSSLKVEVIPSQEDSSRMVLKLSSDLHGDWRKKIVSPFLITTSGSREPHRPVPRMLGPDGLSMDIDGEQENLVVSIRFLVLYSPEVVIERTYSLGMPEVIGYEILREDGSSVGAGPLNNDEDYRIGVISFPPASKIRRLRVSLGDESRELVVGNDGYFHYRPYLDLDSTRATIRIAAVGAKDQIGFSKEVFRPGLAHLVIDADLLLDQTLARARFLEEGNTNGDLPAFLKRFVETQRSEVVEVLLHTCKDGGSNYGVLQGNLVAIQNAGVDNHLEASSALNGWYRFLQEAFLEASERLLEESGFMLRDDGSVELTRMMDEDFNGVVAASERLGHLWQASVQDGGDKETFRSFRFLDDMAGLVADWQAITARRSWAHVVFLPCRMIPINGVSRHFPTRLAIQLNSGARIVMLAISETDSPFHYICDSPAQRIWRHPEEGSKEGGITDVGVPLGDVKQWFGRMRLTLPEERDYRWLTNVVAPPDSASGVKEEWVSSLYPRTWNWESRSVGPPSGLSVIAFRFAWYPEKKE